MGYDADLIKKELERLSTSSFITKWIIEHTPYIFDGYEMEYIHWREEIASKLRIDPSDIMITGSASLGFSLNPYKNFKPFNEKSDIDVSIISHYYFDVAWHDLLYTSRLVISPQMKEALDDHRQRLIYWGTIATDKILPLLSFGVEWDNIIKESKMYPFLVDRDINFRIYKDKLSVRNYLATGTNKLKSKLLEEKIQ